MRPCQQLGRLYNITRYSETKWADNKGNDPREAYLFSSFKPSGKSGFFSALGSGFFLSGWGPGGWTPPGLHTQLALYNL